MYSTKTMGTYFSNIKIKISECVDKVKILLYDFIIVFTNNAIWFSLSLKPKARKWIDANLNNLDV